MKLFVWERLAHKIFRVRVIYLRLKFYFLISIFLLLYSCDGNVEVHEALSKEFTTIEKKYFIETAVGKGHRFITKWNKPVISYSMHGAFKNSDIVFIKNTILNLPKSKTLPKFKFIDTAGDIIFYMPKNIKDFNSAQKMDVEIYGFTRTKTTLDGYFKTAKIFIAPSQSELNNQITIQHELMHALGLNGHPSSDFGQTTALGKRYFTSSTYTGTISSVLPGLDSAALLILYNPVVPTLKRLKYISMLVGINK